MNYKIQRRVAPNVRFTSAAKFSLRIMKRPVQVRNQGVGDLAIDPPEIFKNMFRC